MVDGENRADTNRSDANTSGTAIIKDETPTKVIQTAARQQRQKTDSIRSGAYSSRAARTTDDKEPRVIWTAAEQPGQQSRHRQKWYAQLRGQPSRHHLERYEQQRGSQDNRADTTRITAYSSRSTVKTEQTPSEVVCSAAGTTEQTPP